MRYYLSREEPMKPQVAFLAMTLAVLSPAAENSPFYIPIRNNDLPTLRKLIRDPGPKARDARGNSPLMYAAALGRAITDLTYQKVLDCRKQKGGQKAAR